MHTEILKYNLNMCCVLEQGHSQSRQNFNKCSGYCTVYFKQIFHEKSGTDILINQSPFYQLNRHSTGSKILPSAQTTALETFIDKRWEDFSSSLPLSFSWEDSSFSDIYTGKSVFKLAMIHRLHLL